MQKNQKCRQRATGTLQTCMGFFCTLSKRAWDTHAEECHGMQSSHSSPSTASWGVRHGHEGTSPFWDRDTSLLMPQPGWLLCSVP